MMDNRLHDRIGQVAARFRQLRFLRMMAILSWIATGVVVGIWFLAAGLPLSGIESLLLVVGFTVAAFFVAGITSAFSYRDFHELAKRIEQANPSLRASLLTAIEQRAEPSLGGQGRLSYLQQRVVDRAVAHAVAGQWNETVPSNRLAWARCVMFASLVCMAGAILAARHTPTAAGPLERSLAAAPPAGEVEVLPGDVDLEKGSSLVVTARFASDETPSDVMLVRQKIAADPEDAEASANPDATENEERTAMKRNLDDSLFGGYFAAVEQNFEYRVESSSVRSRNFRVRVFEYPELVRSDALLTPPTYTSIPPKTVENTLRVTAVEGTELTWRIQVNKPLTSVRLVSDDAEHSLDLSPSEDSATHWETTLTLSETRRWKLQLCDEADRENKFPAEFVARVLPNRPAELQLVTATDATVSPIEELPVTAEVKDDFGIHRVGLTYAFGTDEPRDVELVPAIEVASSENASSEIVPDKNAPDKNAADKTGAEETGADENGAGEPKDSQVTHTLDFEQLGAQADQLLSYHFWAEDTGPDGNLRRTTSDIYFAEVRPFEQIFREGDAPPSGPPSEQQQQQAQQAEELAELQKQITTATWNLIRRADVSGASGDSELRAPFLEDAQTILESQQSAIEQLAELAESLPPNASPELVETVANLMQDAAAKFDAAVQNRSRDPLEPALVAARGAYQGLLRLRSREFDVAQSSQSQQGGGGGGGGKLQQQLDQLELKNDANRYESERTAQQQPTAADQQSNEILSRLRDLARRQADLNKQLRDAQLALQQATEEEEREAARRQLQRLREQQQELLEDADKLASEMNRSDASQAAAAEQLQQTRENLRDAEQALRQERPADALASGSRAERELEQVRDEFKKETSAALSETMRQMRSEAAELAEQQQTLEKQMRELEQPAESAGLRTAENGRDEMSDRLRQQGEKTTELLERMRETVREAEESEPLLANRLYEAQREAQQGELDPQLRLASDLLRRGYDPQAQQVTELAGDQIERLETEIEEAAESVLGNPAEALARASSQLDALEQQLAAENREKEEKEEKREASGERREGESQEGQPGPGQSQQPGQGSGQAPGPQSDENESQQPGTAEGSGEGRAAPSTGGLQTAGGPQTGGGGNAAGGLLEGDWTEALGGSQPSELSGNPIGERPITGDGFREWTDALREVEDMLEDPELRSRAAGIRDRAREMRREVKRHASEPQWSEIEELIAEPLRQLRVDVAAELLRRSAERHAVVPIDRDPVPEDFADAVRKYYEQLGTGR